MANYPDPNDLSSQSKKNESKDSTFSDNKTDRSSSNQSFNVQIPSISLPKGGGAIKSIDEKFSVNAVNGTAGFSIPFPFSPSRNEFGPSLSLNYSSGAGNGPFGLGWKAEPFSIHRRTDKQLPYYDDVHESDVFSFSGTEDLVPAYNDDGLGNWIKDEKTIAGDVVSRYRPRVEGSFARIEKVKEPNGNVYWRVISKENVTSIFGKNPTARVADPNDPARIFKWLLEFSSDDKGNCFSMEYKTENFDNVTNVLHEKNRLNNLAKISNTYLKNIKYCNKESYLQNAIPEYLLELVLDYGEHDLNNPQPNDPGLWSCRLDPFSDYHAGFEIRTYRLCKRLLMFHLFPELGNTPCLVKSVELTYDSSETFTFLSSFTQTGFIRKQDGTYTNQSLPPVEFAYQPSGWDTTIKSISTENIVNDPVGIDDRNYQWVDLYGEGISGILTEQASALFYKSNLGNGEFTVANLVAPKPSFTGVSSGVLLLQDIKANGIKSLVSREAQGYFELTEEDEWLPFQNFKDNPVVNWNDPNLKMLDLNGDGQADVLITEDEVFTWYQSNGTEGYDNALKVRKAVDEEKGPNIIFAFSDPTQSIVLADMSGDGLMDIVRIRNGEVVYWPNIGYGNFGAKVTMSNSPLFDYNDTFNPRYVKLADIDGSGTTDIIYLGKDNFKVYFNQSGNLFSDEKVIDPFPKIDETANVSFIDLLGNGTNCLTWSSPLPGNSNAPLQYIDLMGGQKPHVMIGYKNNLGKEVTLEYKPSTFFYLEDKQAGTPWVTKLPFPVQCVARVEVIDRITRTRFVNDYKYHHGFYDYVGREFRGFGMVEQTDTDNFEVYVTHVDPKGNQTFDEQLYQQPVLTKKWFHTGAFLNKKQVLHQFASEYFQNPNEHEIIEPTLPDNLNAEEWSEALRACKGIPLRIEVYALDGTSLQDIPYSTAQHNCLINLIQPLLQNKYASFFVMESETLTYNYERNINDPRIAHSINVEIDQYGNVLQSAIIAYGRLTADPDLAVEDQRRQSETHIIYNYSNVTNIIDDNANYRLPVIYETQTYQVTGATPETDGFFLVDKLKNDFQTATGIKYEDSPTDGLLQKRLIEHVRHYFIKDDLSIPLLLGQIDSKALIHQTIQLAFTSTLVTSRYGGKVTDPTLVTEGGYIHSEGDSDYWIASSQPTYDPVHFYQVTAVTDPFGNVTSVKYDNTYYFYVQATSSPLINGVNNVIEVMAFNFRTTSPYLIKSENNNLSAARFNELGLVVKTFVMGKEGENKGDFFDVASVETSPNDQPSATLEYTFDNWYNQTLSAGFDITNYKPNPNVVKSSARELHYFDDPNPSWLIKYTYSDGSNHEVMSKIPAESGDVKLPDGTILSNVNPRWVGDGRTILNNKGKPVKQFEPFFSTTFDYEDDKDLVQGGVSPIIYYDPLDRVIRTNFPDGSYSTVEFDAWKQITNDQDDTVLLSQWYIDHGSPDPTGTEPSDKSTRAAWLTAIIANTPTTVYFDSLLRNFLSVQFNRTFKIDNVTKKAINITDELFKSWIIFDIENNQRELIDARANTVMEYQYDMLSNKVYQNSMDSGQRWMLNDVLKKPLRTWDSRQHAFRYSYDVLHRLVKTFVSTNNNPEINFEKIVYGEGLTNDTILNLRGQTYQHFDTAGLITNDEFDFKGNLLSSSRQLLSDYKNDNDWNTNPSLEADIFTSTSRYDALNRPVTMTAPDNSIITPSYNEANLLEKIDINIRGALTLTSFVKNIDYNEKGHRNGILYGNDVKIKYTYEDKTFRLVQILTTGKNGTDLLQKLSYNFDPVGNITSINDEAQQTFYFNNAVVSPSGDYVYDAIYRLINANGREHIGQNQPPTSLDEFRTNLPQPGDGIAMRNYTEQYQYDIVGNMLQMIHSAGAGSWTRSFTYETINNHLLSSTVGGSTENFTYDAHGNMTSMAGMPVIDLNFRDEMQHLNLLGGGNVYFTYNAAGQRVRKVNELQGGLIKERIYLGGYELYRERTNGTISFERQTLHVMDEKKRIALVETKTIDVTDNTNLNLPLIRYQLDNHLGSSCLELNQNTDIISYEEYYPFGGTAYQAINQNIKAAAKRYRYTDKERDEETGFYYFGVRYYAPWLARWTAVDPVGAEDGLNVYLYTKNNPLVFTDLDGKQTTPPGTTYDNRDVILRIIELEKPGDVASWWADQVRPHKEDWTHPLSELEQSYIQTFRNPSIPSILQMRVPVDPTHLTGEEREAAERLFGRTQGDYERYANYENRRRIIAHYVYTHPATVSLEMGIYRLFRDVNPIHFAFERGWQIGSGHEMFTGDQVSRLGAAVEFFANLAVIYGVGRALSVARPPTGGPTVPARPLTAPIYDLPSEGGGMEINGRWYTEHALERMAPDTPQIRAELRTRASARIERLGIRPDNPAYDSVLRRALQRIDPRGVPPSVVEAEIMRPGSTNVRVITARGGQVVVTVMPR
jgi:RHS repeat-associated protein